MNHLPLRNTMHLGCNCQHPSGYFGLGETTFGADQVVGKSLLAKRTIQLKSGSFDNSPVVGTVATGQPVGVVSTFLSPGPNRSALHWAVLNNGRTLYVKHEEGAFDVSNLVVQGSKTTEQIQQEKLAEELKENDPVAYYFKKLVMPVLVGGAVIYVAVQLGKTFIQSKVKTA